MVSQAFRQLNNLRKASNGLTKAEISEAAQSYGDYLQAKAMVLEAKRERDTHIEGSEGHTGSQITCDLAEKAGAEAAVDWKTKLEQLKANHPKLKKSFLTALSLGDPEMEDAANDMLHILANPEAASTKDERTDTQQGMDG